jgi:hypothetical protein
VKSVHLEEGDIKDPAFTMFLYISMEARLLAGEPIVTWMIR